LQTLQEFPFEEVLRVTGFCHSDASPQRDTQEESVLQTLRGFPFEEVLRVTGFCHSGASPRRNTPEESILQTLRGFPFEEVLIVTIDREIHPVLKIYGFQDMTGALFF
jgi:hypothetical protein